MILNNGKSSHLLNWDIRHLRISRLDSSDGPLMVVDMNYPEYKDLSILSQGPWRDSHAGNAAGSQKVPGTYYYNDAVQYDEFAIRGNPDDPDPVFNGGILNLKTLPVPYLEDNNRGKNACSFYTVHLGAPWRTVRTYIGGGNYEVRGRGRQISHWEVNNTRGDLSEFHPLYTDPNGNNDSDQRIFVQKVLHKNDIAIDTPWVSYSSLPNNSVQDIEINNSAYAYILSHNDEVVDAGGPSCGVIRRYSTGYGTGGQQFGSWVKGSSTPFRVPTTIAALDSDWFNADSEGWWISYRSTQPTTIRGYAHKFRMQLGPSANGAPSYGDDNLKVLIHCSGIRPQRHGWPGAGGFVDEHWIISATMNNYGGGLTIDSDQYHFNWQHHPGFYDSSEPATSVYFDDRIDAFDISQDGKIMTLLVTRFDGARFLMNFVLDTPWDLSTVQPFDWYDDAAGSGQTRNGDTLGPGQALNNPTYKVSGNTATADSALTYNMDNVADWHGMTRKYFGIDWDDLSSKLSDYASGTSTTFDSAFSQINSFGNELADMDSNGSVTSADATIITNFGNKAKHLRDSDSFALYSDSSRLQAKIDELILAPINHSDSGHTSIADFYEYYKGDLNPHVNYTGAASYRRGWMADTSCICWNHTGEYLYVVNNYGGVVQYECTHLRDSTAQVDRSSFCDSGSPGEEAGGTVSRTGNAVFYGRPGL